MTYCYKEIIQANTHFFITENIGRSSIQSLYVRLQYLVGRGEQKETTNF